MYKVFVNNFPLLVSSNPSHIEEYRCVKQINLREFKVILNDLLNGINGPVLVKTYPAVALKLIKSHLKFIEAAGGIVMNEKNEMLWIKRHGIWDLPKGKVEKNEHISETAIREVQEECGLVHLKSIKKLESTFHVYELKGKFILKESHWYLMKTADKVTKAQVEEGITEVCFFPLENINEPLKNTYSSILELVKNVLPILKKN